MTNFVLVLSLPFVMIIQQAFALGFIALTLRIVLVSALNSVCLRVLLSFKVF